LSGSNAAVAVSDRRFPNYGLGHIAVIEALRLDGTWWPLSKVLRT